MNGQILKIHAQQFSDLKRQKDDITALAEMVVEVMNAAATGGNNMDLLGKKLHKLFSASKNPLEHRKSLVGAIPSLANIYCNGLATYLRMRYKELNDRDLLLCSLIALGASSSCISMVFGYEHHVTFYNIRAKIRRKMDVPQQLELEAFIAEIVARLDEAAGESRK